MNMPLDHPTGFPTGPGVTTGQDIQELVERVQRLIERIDRQAQKMIDNLNKTLRWLPGDMEETIQRGVDEFYSLFRRLVQELTDPLRKPGSASALLETGGKWTAEVERRFGDTASIMDEHYAAIDNIWEGDAAEAYKACLRSQHQAFKELTKEIGKIETCLAVLAGALIAFWIEAIAALVAFLVEVGAAAVVAFTPAAPTAPEIAGTAAVVATTTMTAAMAALAALMSTAAITASNLKQGIAGSTELQHGHWPRATTMETASSNWRPD